MKTDRSSGLSWSFGTSLGHSGPPFVIATKIDRSASLSFAIRGIPLSIRPPIRHSGEGRNPEGWGEGIVALDLVPPLTAHRKFARVCATRRRAIFVLSCGLRKAIVIPANSLPLTPDTMPEAPAGL